MTDSQMLASWEKRLRRNHNQLQLLERGWLQLQADIDLVEIAFRAASKALLKSAKSAARKRPRRRRQARSVA
jgi:hypothetical protein